MDIVKREEFEAVREMALKAREENDALLARIAALEARLRSERPNKSPVSHLATECGAARVSARAFFIQNCSVEFFALWTLPKKPIGRVSYDPPSE